MIPLVAPHHAVLRLNTRLFPNCLEGARGIDDLERLQHDAYPVGRLALLRKHFGPGAMRYR